MVELRDRETIVTPVSDGGAGAAAMVILALIFVAILGYCIYAFTGGPNHTFIERDNTSTTIQQPIAAPSAPVPAPAAPAPVAPIAPVAPVAPAAPSADSSSSGSNQ
jgi:hypothetical protein